MLKGHKSVPVHYSLSLVDYLLNFEKSPKPGRLLTLKSE